MKARLVVFHFLSTFVNTMVRFRFVVTSVDLDSQERDTDDVSLPQVPLG